MAHRVSGGIAVALMLMHCVLFVDGFCTVVRPPVTEMFGLSTIVQTLPTTIMVGLSLVTETLGGGATTRSMATCASLVAEQAQSAASSLMASATTNTVLAAAATGSLVIVGAVAGTRKCSLKRNSANSSTASIEISGDNSDDDVSDAQHVPIAKRHDWRKVLACAVAKDREKFVAHHVSGGIVVAQFDYGGGVRGSICVDLS